MKLQAFSSNHRHIVAETRASKGKRRWDRLAAAWRKTVGTIIPRIPRLMQFSRMSDCFGAPSNFPGTAVGGLNAS